MSVLTRSHTLHNLGGGGGGGSGQLNAMDFTYVLSQVLFHAALLMSVTQQRMTATVCLYMFKIRESYVRTCTYIQTCNVGVVTAQSMCSLFYKYMCSCVVVQLLYFCLSV